MKKTDRIILAKKSLGNIDSQSFSCSLYASEGGSCGGGYDTEEELFLEAENILYLIKQKLQNDEVFEGVKVSEFNLDSYLEGRAHEAAWPNGGLCVSVNNVIPDELNELAKKLSQLDASDKQTVEAIRDELMSVESGKYTFYFTVTDSEGSYYFTEDGCETITLTKEEALGILYGAFGKNGVFNGICNKAFDSSFIEDKSEEADFAADYDYLSYWGESKTLDNYLESWVALIEMILAGEVNEDAVDEWLEYFDSPYNWDCTIEEWMEESDI